MLGWWGEISGVLEQEKGHLNQPWDGGGTREGFLEEVMPSPRQEGASQMKGVDTRMGRGVPNSGESMKAADPVSAFPSQMSLPGFHG